MFINRNKELKELKNYSKLALTGRRRIGKSALVDEYLKDNNGLRLQAIESTQALQLQNIWAELQEYLPISIEPQSFEDLFELINVGLMARTNKEKFTICFDEFPYLYETDNSIASRFQKWLDSKKFPKNLQVIFCGSSRSMMHLLFERSSSPLFDRCEHIIRLPPLSYKHFCEFLKLPALDLSSFTLYSLVGGIPKYWHLLKHGDLHPLVVVTKLFMDSTAYFENEPERILRDEKIDGISALGVFDAIGRGANKPSEIAARAGIPVNGLSRLLKFLTETYLIKVVTPFGMDENTTKNRIYIISDPALRFWYSVARVHREKWRFYDEKKQSDILKIHVGAIMEQSIREYYQAQNYWERSNLEIDLVRYNQENYTEIIVSEIKLRKLKKMERLKIHQDLDEKILSSQLVHKYISWKSEVLDETDCLNLLANEAGATG